MKRLKQIRFSESQARYCKSKQTNSFISGPKMQNNLRANFELGAQVIIAIAVLVVAGVLIKRQISPQRLSPYDRPRINAGERLNLPDVDWKQSKKRLVFFLNKDCHYCTASAPFYKQLTEEGLKHGRSEERR